jgi:fumarate hydratase, class I
MSKPVCVISEPDFVASIADALQYVAVYHPPSFVRALAECYAAEDSPAARDAIAQILINSKMAAYGRRPICQDTGAVNVFVKIGTGARIDSTRRPAELSTTRWPSRSTSYGPNTSRCWRR